MYYLGYSPGTITSLYIIKKTSNNVVATAVGKTSGITVEEAVKQENIFGPIICLHQHRNIRKGTLNCKRMEIEKKMIYGLMKTRYMVINKGMELEEAIDERVKEGIVQETDIYKYLGIVINKTGNLRDHIK